MYLNSWDEFEKAAQNLYLQDPMKVRYDMKYTHSKNLLKIKLTDNAVCLQYKTENQPEVKKVEKFISNLMRHMASKDHIPSAALYDQPFVHNDGSKVETVNTIVNQTVEIQVNFPNNVARGGTSSGFSDVEFVLKYVSCYGNEGNFECLLSDHSKCVLEKLATFYNMELMNDIVLVVRGIEYPTHRLMLCKSSEVFQDLIYLCTEYMCNHLALAATNNQLVIWYQFTLSLGHHVAALACQDFLKCNFEMVAKSKDFGNCNRKIVSRLLQWNDLVVTNEITLFHLIEGWLEYQQQTRLEEGVDMIEPLVYEVMSHVRFPMMTPRQLVDLLVSPLVMKYKGFFIERMAASMSFHRNQKEIMQRVLQDKNGALMFTPRLYTAKSTCCTLTIDKFTQFPSYQTRSFICSSPSGWAEHLGDKYCDWVVNVSPREVRFFKSSLNAPSYLIPLPEKTLKTVRVSITSKNDTTEFVKVKIGVLVVGVEDGVEHIIRVVHKIYYFNKDDHLLNIDNVIPFEELTCTRLRRGIRYQVGPDFDTLKLHVVIVPLTEESSTAPQPNLLWSMR